MTTPCPTRRQVLGYMAASSFLLPSLAKAWPGDSARTKLRFAILSDLHYSVYPDIANTYPRTLNSLDPHADFVVMAGDLVNDDAAYDGRSNTRDYNKFKETVWGDFIRYTDQIHSPIRPVIGNHDFFFPGRPWEGFLANLVEKDPRLTADFDEYVRKCWDGRFSRCYYDWEQAGWHFMVLPCGSDEYLRKIGFFKWFEQRMQATAGRPTMVFMHVPPLRIGMTDHYFTTIEQQAYFLDAFSRHGAVHSVFAGHIHNSTLVSMDSARIYNGTRYFSVPQHIWNQRPFGRHQKLDIEYKTHNHGFLCVTIDQDDQVHMSSCFPGNEEVVWPETFPSQSYEDNPINFNPIPALPAVESDLAFTPGLAEWNHSFNYTELKNPSIVREVGDNGDAILTLHGRANPNEDFQLVPLDNILFQMLPFRKSARLALEGEYQIEKFQFGSTELTEALYPDLFQNRKWAAPLYRPPWYFNIGFCGITTFQNEKPLASGQMLFGQWSTDRNSDAPQRSTGNYSIPNEQWLVDSKLPPQPDAWTSSWFQTGEFSPLPQNRQSVVSQQIAVGERRRFRIVLPESGSANVAADKVLVVVGLSCDNMPGRLLRVRFGGLRLTQG